MKEADLVIQKGIVLTQDADDRVLYDGGIAVKDGIIEAIGPSDEISQDYCGSQVIDASRKAVLPGFVNTHFHFTQNFMKGTRDDLDLLDWIAEVSFPRIKVVVDEYRQGKADIHSLAAIHAGIDLLSSGVTCTANMEWGMRPEIKAAYDLLGMRIVNILTLTDVESWTPKEAIIEPDEVFDLADELIETFRCQDSRTDFAYGIACPNSATEVLIRRAREAATKNNTLLHIHLAETKFEYEKFLKTRKMTPTRYLDSLGFWGSDTWAAHSIWLDPEDIDTLAEKGVGVAHNPKCNMKIADGAAPISAMKKKGIHVGLGIDSCAVSDNTDFFEAMRTMIFLQRVTTMDPTALLGRDALRMATIEGAKSIGKGDELGSLEPGKKADMLVVDLTNINSRPYNDIVNNLVFAANSNNIETVLIEGEIVVNRGEFTRFDKNEQMNAVEKKAAEIYRAAGIEIPPHFAIEDY